MSKTAAMFDATPYGQAEKKTSPAPNPKFSIGQAVCICPDPATGGLPVMRSSTLMRETGTVESIQFTGNAADRTARELVTVALPDLGFDTNRRFLVSANYLKAV